MQVSEANQEYNEEIIAEREAILQRKKDKILQRFVSVSLRWTCNPSSDNMMTWRNWEKNKKREDVRFTKWLIISKILWNMKITLWLKILSQISNGWKIIFLLSVSHFRKYCRATNCLNCLVWSTVLDMLDNTTYKLQQLFFEYTNCLIYAQNEELDRRIGT